MSVKAVVFDLGKVLVDFDYGIAATKLAEKSAKPASEIQALIDQSPLLSHYERAQMTTEQFFDEVRRRIGFRGDFDEFSAAFADIFTEIPEMTRLNFELRSRDIPTFVLSNTNEIAIGHVRRNFPFFAHFTDYVFSFEHGVLKPEQRIYEVAEERAGCHAAEILFLDDKPENCRAGEQRGWQAICHRSSEESVAVVRGLISRGA